MHEAAFELIEIPHIKLSGNYSADIRMVFDALDLCYAKQHIDTFEIITGESNFSPVVSKLREKAKTVIVVGVNKSTSDLLISIFDKFIYYDDLVASGPTAISRSTAKRKTSKKTASGKADPAHEAIDLVIDTMEALYAERKDRTKPWGSTIRQTLERRRPGFNESIDGFGSFIRPACVSPESAVTRLATALLRR